MRASQKDSVFEKDGFNLYEVRRLIKETADNIPTLIDHFSSYKTIDADRIGMVGVSMGGFIAFRALVIDDRIGVAAPVIASPYFDESLKSNYRQRPDNLKFIQEENIGHEFTASMWHNVIKWFNKHL